MLVKEGDRKIHWDSQTTAYDPPLLYTCRQIRSEARTIFYGENKLVIEVVAFDVSNVVRWLDADPARDALYRTSELNMWFAYESSKPFSIPLWANLLAWIDFYCQHRCRRVAGSDCEVGWVFDLVDELLLKKGMTMQKLHNRLEKFRRSELIPEDSQWAV